ncbi:MAG: DNA polymerase III subunit delta [Gemmatimonadaceae bacterium]
MLIVSLDSSLYYLYGDEDFLKEQAVRELIEAKTDPATRDFNLDNRSAVGMEARTLNSLLSTPPMMADRRVVVLRDVASLKKEARSALDLWIAHAPPDTVLVMVAAGARDEKLEKVLGKKAIVSEFQPLVGKRLSAWIVDHAARVLQRSITTGAMELLQSTVGTDLASLALELDKLASYTSGEIDEDAVSAVVGTRRGEALGDLLDRIAERDAPAALAILPRVLDQPKTTAVTVVMALSTQTLALAWAQASPGSPDFWALLQGSKKAYTGRPWGEAVRTWSSAFRRWNPETLDSALETLLAADLALKDKRLSSEEQILTGVVLALCA